MPLARFDVADGHGEATDFKVVRITDLPRRTVITRQGRGEICADGFRLDWANVATFDARADRQIGYLTHENWRGIMPDAFFSTVAALSVAGIGMLPMHASAIEFDGRAFLFAGSAGAGKSTLTAELLAHGARFLGDDLTVLRPPDGRRGFWVTRGRPAMRLHPATAALVAPENCEHVPDDPRGKLLVRPVARAADKEYPLAGILLIGLGPAEVSSAEALRLLPSQIFRPRWLSRMPGHGQRRAWLIEMAGSVPVRRLPEISGFDADARQSRMTAALKALEL